MCFCLCASEENKEIFIINQCSKSANNGEENKKVGTLIASNHTFSITCELAREDAMVASDGVGQAQPAFFRLSAGGGSPVSPSGGFFRFECSQLASIIRLDGRKR